MNLKSKNFIICIAFLLIFLPEVKGQGSSIQLGGWGNSYELSLWQGLSQQTDKHWLNVRLGINDWVKPPNTEVNNPPPVIENFSFSLGYGYQVTDLLMPYLTIRKDLHHLENIGIVTGLDIQPNARFVYTVGFTSTYDINKNWDRSNGWVNIYYRIKKIKLNLGAELSMDVHGEIGYLWLISKSLFD